MVSGSKQVQEMLYKEKYATKTVEKLTKSCGNLSRFRRRTSHFSFRDGYRTWVCWLKMSCQPASRLAQIPVVRSN